MTNPAGFPPGASSSASSPGRLRSARTRPASASLIGNRHRQFRLLTVHKGGTAMRRRIAALTVTALLTGAAGISAQIYAPQTLERYFRLEWQGTHGGGRLGGGPKGGRAYFGASVPEATSYRVQVLSFDWIGGGGSGGGM